jgi:hypothetical protein
MGEKGRRLVAKSQKYLHRLFKYARVSGFNCILGLKFQVAALPIRNLHQIAQARQVKDTRMNYLTLEKATLFIKSPNRYFSHY